MHREELWAFMSGHKLAVLGSVSRNNTPQAALVGIAVTPALEIVFDTLTTTRKHANLLRNPACSFVIGCVDEVTLQYEGEAEELSGDALGRYQPVYFAQWPDGLSRQSWPHITYFVVRPRWIRFTDYRSGSPFIEEFRFDD